MQPPSWALYWQRCIEGMYSFMHNKDKTTLKIVTVPFVMVNDPFLRLRKEVGEH